MLQMASRITGLWGGACLAVGCNGEFVAFYDWATGQLVQRVDGDVRGLSWSDDGRFVALHSAQASYLLEFHAERMAAHLGESAAGVEGCLEVLSELDGSEQSGVWYMHVFSQRMHGVCFCKRRRGEKTYFRQACMRREGPVFSRRKGVVGFSVQIMEKEPAVGA